ncbi:MAG: GNAT family N-acetyltransferase [Elusimicrobiota bacterium]
MIRKALPKDMDGVYLMGRDVWGKGPKISEYLAECRSSLKYKQGEWFLLEDAELEAVSSLIVYRLPPDDAGIGSIATTPKKRGNGFAAQLIRSVVEALDARHKRAIYLFSDIPSRYYDEFGFKALPSEYQMHPGSTCMIRSLSIAAILKADGFRPPPYF